MNTMSLALKPRSIDMAEMFLIYPGCFDRNFSTICESSSNRCSLFPPLKALYQVRHCVEFSIRLGRFNGKRMEVVFCSKGDLNSLHFHR